MTGMYWQCMYQPEVVREPVWAGSHSGVDMPT